MAVPLLVVAEGKSGKARTTNRHRPSAHRARTALIGMGRITPKNSEGDRSDNLQAGQPPKRASQRPQLARRRRHGR